MILHYIGLDGNWHHAPIEESMMFSLRQQYRYSMLVVRKQAEAWISA